MRSIASAMNSGGMRSYLWTGEIKLPLVLMIRRILLRNWKSHEQTELEFGKGTNLLVGIMGAGKSAVLDAMSFALFGTFPALAARRVRLSEIVMSRPQEKKEAEVELEFEWEGKEYSVKRSVGKDGGSEAELRREGTLIISEPEKVTEEVERLLKINYELFCRAIYAEQNRIDYFLLLGPGERKAQIDELLGIDRFEAARGNIVSAANLLKKRKEEKEAALRRGDEAEIARQASGAKAEAEGIEKRIAEARKGNDAAKRERDDAAGKFAGLDGKKKEWEGLRERKARADYLLERLRKELAEKGAAEKIDAAEEARLLSAAKERLAEASRRAVSAERELGRLEADAKRKVEMEKAMAKLSSEFGAPENISGKMAKAKAGFEAAQGEVVKQGALIGDLEIAVEELAKEAAACPVCERAMDAGMRERLLRKKREGAAAARAAEADARGKAASAKKEIAALESAAKEAERISVSLSELSGVEGKVGEAGGKAEAAGAEKAKIEEEIAKRAERVETAKKMAEAAGAEEELKSAAGMIAALGFDERAYEAARSAVNAARERELKCRADLDVASANLNAAKERIRNLEREIAAMAGQKAEIAKYSKTAEELGLLNSAVVETQAALRGELIGAINEMMAEIWPVIYPYRDYSGVRLRPAEKDYLLELCVKGDWVAVERIASGGERSCASLVLRIALAMVLVPNLKWLVLDEPTHNLDENGIRALVEALHERIPEIVEQMFVITHDENLKDAASARLYRFERNKELDEPTRVVAIS